MNKLFVVFCYVTIILSMVGCSSVTRATPTACAETVLIRPDSGATLQYDGQIDPDVLKEVEKTLNGQSTEPWKIYDKCNPAYDAEHNYIPGGARAIILSQEGENFLLKQVIAGKVSLYDKGYFTFSNGELR